MFKLRTFALYLVKCLNATVQNIYAAKHIFQIYIPPGGGEKERKGGVLAWLLGGGGGMSGNERKAWTAGGNEKAGGRVVVGSALGGLRLCPAQCVWRCVWLCSEGCACASYNVSRACLPLKS